MVGSRLRPIRTIALAAAAAMGLLALTDWLDSPVSVAVMVIASVITVSDNGLAFTAIAEIAGPFWSGRALGTQNTSQLLTAGIAPPLFGGLDRQSPATPRRSRCARCFRSSRFRWCRRTSSATTLLRCGRISD